MWPNIGPLFNNELCATVNSGVVIKYNREQEDAHGGVGYWNSGRNLRRPAPNRRVVLCMQDFPVIEKRRGKSGQYMFGHIVLPRLLFEHPELLSHLASEDPAQAAAAIWQSYAEQWGLPSVDPEIRVRWYRNTDGGLAVAIDLPQPEEVPEPHGVLLVLKPERAFFVIERTSPENLQKYLRTAWVRMSSDGGESSTPNHAGFLCEWTGDGGHRNYRYVALNVGSMLTKVNALVGSGRQMGGRRTLVDLCRGAIEQRTDPCAGTSTCLPRIDSVWIGV